MKARVSTMAVGAVAAVAGLAATTVNHAAPNSKSGAVSMTPATRVAVVDIVKVFDSFEQTVVLNKKLDAYTKELFEEADKRQKEGEAEQKALEAFATDSAEYFKQNEKVKRLMFENEVWKQIKRDGIAESHKRWVLRTYQLMRAEIEKVAKAHNVDVVLTQETLKTDVPDSKALLAQILNIKVMYASPEIDMSAEVLANLNAAFTKRGGAASIEFGK
jgi:Skp family chaperone for outer membrane proteins